MSLLSGYGSTAKFPTIGTKVAGRVTRDAEEMQQRDFETGAPEFWDDGKPKMQLVVTVQTGETGPGDDGERSVYVKGQMLKATQAACRAQRLTQITEGSYFEVTYVGDEPLPPGKRGFPKKLYQVVVTPPPAGGEPARQGHQESLKASVDRRMGGSSTLTSMQATSNPMTLDQMRAASKPAGFGEEPPF